MAILRVLFVGLPSCDRAVLSKLDLVIAVIAAAAFLRTILRSEFRPAISTIEGTIMMSDSPMKEDVSPEATVDTMSFGNPKGRAALMTLAASDVPPVPPRDTIPWIDRFRYRSWTTIVPALLMDLITSPRLSDSIFCSSCGRVEITSRLLMFMAGSVDGILPTSTNIVLTPSLSNWIFMNLNSLSLVSSVPNNKTQGCRDILNLTTSIEGLRFDLGQRSLVESTKGR